MRIAVLVALTVAVLVVVVVGLALWRRPPHDRSLTLVLTALAVTVGVSIAALPLLLDDGGVSGAAVTIVPPVLLTGLAALAVWWWPTAGLVATWLATVLMGAYVLVFSLGLGLFYGPAALLLLAAALTGTVRAVGVAREGQPV